MRRACFRQANTPLKRFHLTYRDEHKKDIHKSYLYRENRYAAFDSLRLQECTLAIFYAEKKDPSIQDIPFYVMMLPVGDSLFVKETWLKRADTNSIRTFEQQQEIIGRSLRLEYVVAGSMPAHKQVELFVQGVLSNARSNLENAIAHNIQLAAYLDGRLPYLFAYNYIAADGAGKPQKTIVFENLLARPLDDFEKDAEWAHQYALLKEKNLLIPYSMDFWHEKQPGHI